MKRDEAVRVVLAEAARYVGEEEKPRGSNRSSRIDYWLLEANVDPGLAWCAAFVGQVGRQALGASWPVPRTASVHDPKRRWPNVVSWAEEHELLVAGPHVGDLFVLWNESLGRYAHIGFVETTDAAAVDPGRATALHTIEGNTNSGGSREGYGVFRRVRPPGPGIMYVRWTAALDQPPNLVG